MTPDFPKSLIHPDHSPALISVGQAGGMNQQQSRPERFPPVVVHTEDQEARERARGYLLPGESRPHVEGYAAYPMMMEHPEFEPEVKPYTEGKENSDGTFKTWHVAGQPGKFPPKIAGTADEEGVLREQGYVPGGHADHRAYQRAQAQVNMDYHPAEWPKYVNGVLMKDPATPMRLDEYPKYVAPAAGGLPVIVNSWEEEAKVTGRGSSKGEPVKGPPPPVVVADDAEWREFQAWKAAQATMGPAVVDERSQLAADAAELGVEVDRRWGIPRLHKEIAQAREKQAAD